MQVQRHRWQARPQSRHQTLLKIIFRCAEGLDKSLHLSVQPRAKGMYAFSSTVPGRGVGAPSVPFTRPRKRHRTTFPLLFFSASLEFSHRPPILKVFDSRLPRLTGGPSTRNQLIPLGPKPIRTISVVTEIISFQ